jgi:ribosomal-protein-alanine N-acetyltransferase
MIIRPATLLDLDAILQIENDTFDSPWTRDHFVYELQENPFSFVFIAEEKGYLVGYVDWWKTFEVGQLNNLAVVKALRGKGIGRTLLIDTLQRMIKAGCQRSVLEVRISNEAAISLYQSMGFEKSHLKKQYYENGEDAWAMIKEFE